MELKLFAAKRKDSYSGGLIVVAANSIDEAYQTYIDWVEATGNPNCLYERYVYANGEEVVEYNRYPRENWYEISGVTVVCEKSRVLDEDGYTE